MNIQTLHLKVINTLIVLCVLVSTLPGCGSEPQLNPDAYPANATEDPVRESSAEPADATASTEPAEETFSVQSNYTITRKNREKTVSMGDADTWTIFIYMCGTDLESENGLASLNLQALMDGPEAHNVRYILQTGGTKQWGVGNAELREFFGIEEYATRSLVNPEKLQRWEITDTMTLLDEQELASMADPETLADFLTWGVENYPAEKMGVVGWNHGGGSISGVFVDELFDKNIMSLLQLEYAFDRVYESMTDKFEFVAFDACLMGSVEIANILAPHARYMYASEEVVPGFGWGDYSFLTKAIDKNPGMDGAEFGTILCDEFFNFYRDIEMESTVTFSVVDLEKIDDVLYALNNMAIEIKGGSANPSYFAEISRGVARVENYAFPHMVDLSDLAENLAELAPESCKTVQKAVEEAVVHHVNGGSRAFANGLSVFYPTNEVHLGYLSRYGLTPASPNYLDYISDFLFKKSRYTTLGREFVNVTNEPHIAENGSYSMSIDPSTYDHVQTFGCQLYYDLGNGKFAIYGFDDDVQYDANTGVVTDKFEGKWASIDGVPFFLSLKESNAVYNLYHSPIILNGKNTFLIMQWIWNMSEPDEGHYEILGTWSGADPFTGLASRETRQLAPGDRIIPRYVIVSGESVVSEEMVEDTSEFLDENGDLIYTGWTESVTYGSDTKMEHAKLRPGDYYYQFGVIDIFGGQQTYVPIAFAVGEDGAPVVKDKIMPVFLPGGVRPEA